MKIAFDLFDIKRGRDRFRRFRLRIDPAQILPWLMIRLLGWL